MAYSQKVIQRFEDVLKNPEAHAVGRFDPADPNVATAVSYTHLRAHETREDRVWAGRLVKK